MIPLIAELISDDDYVRQFRQAGKTVGRTFHDWLGVPIPLLETCLVTEESWFRFNVHHY